MVGRSRQMQVPYSGLPCPFLDGDTNFVEVCVQTFHTNRSCTLSDIPICGWLNSNGQTTRGWLNSNKPLTTKIGMPLRGQQRDACCTMPLLYIDVLEENCQSANPYDNIDNFYLTSPTKYKRRPQQYISSLLIDNSQEG